MLQSIEKATVQAATASGFKLRAGHVITVLVTVFLLFDSVMKFVQPAPVVQASAQLGVPAGLTAGIGAILLACTILYLIPATSILGALLLTGYLGGALFSQLRIGAPVFGDVLFPVYFGALLWAGLLLREERLRALIPFRR